MTLATATRREVLGLVVLVVALDALFVTAYFVAHVRGASDTAKLAFTAVWTLSILFVAVRGLSRIKSARLKSTGKERPS
jgi:hypothetical protein